MKNFLTMGTNQTCQFYPQSEEFHLVSEIVITVVEPDYSVGLTTDPTKFGVEKYPKSETFRFFADPKNLITIRDRINEELELLKKLNDKFGGDE